MVRLHFITDFMKNAIKQTEYIPHDGEPVHRPESVAEEAMRLRVENARLREALTAAHEFMEDAVCDSINVADELEKWDRAFGSLLPNVDVSRDGLRPALARRTG
jgi:regulator of replication initiation timing